MALKRIKKQRGTDIIGEYHKINNISSAYDTIQVEIYSSEQDREDFKNGVFDNRFKKTDTFTNYRASLDGMIKSATELPPNCNTIADAILYFGYESLKLESDFYTSEFFENC